MAERADFREDMIVIDTKTNRRGVVVRDPWNVCAPHEVPVQFDGETGYLGTDWRDLCAFDFDEPDGLN
jgi:hypothetical protein